jgi:hypothetical protein
MKKATIRGTGQLNGPVIVNKELELDDQIARALLGSKREEVLKGILNAHYPGVKFDYKKIGVQIS